MSDEIKRANKLKAITELGDGANIAFIANQRDAFIK